MQDIPKQESFSVSHGWVKLSLPARFLRFRLKHTEIFRCLSDLDNESVQDDVVLIRGAVQI